jgi:hypothetical protein
MKLGDDIKNRQVQFEATEPKLDQLIRYSVEDKYNTVIIAYPGTQRQNGGYLQSAFVFYCGLVWHGCTTFGCFSNAATPNIPSSSESTQRNLKLLITKAQTRYRLSTKLCLN